MRAGKKGEFMRPSLLSGAIALAVAAVVLQGCDAKNPYPMQTPTAAPISTSTAIATATAGTPTAEATPTTTGGPIDRLPVDQTISIPGLGGKVDVVTDENGVQHIVGPDLNTVLYIQGYVTASLRFWEMDAFRRLAEGRLSEAFGSLLLSTDVEMRTLFTTRDGRRLEEALWQRLQADDPSGAASLQSYTSGVNAWLEDLRAGRNGATLPPEYTFALINLSAADLADWRPQDTIAIGRYQAWSLSSTLDEEISRQERVDGLPDALREDIFRFAPATQATVLPPLQQMAKAPLLKPKSLPSKQVLEQVHQMLARLAETNPLGDRRRGLGSNDWIVSPQLSATGHAMLANDPHLALLNPPIWHMVQLIRTEAPQGEVRMVNGVNFPGIPGIILGNNDFGAWGATVSVFDVTDVYVEQVTTPADYPASPRTVLFKGQQVPVLRDEEVFNIKGAAPVTKVIEVVPHHGPMVPDPNINDDVEGLAATGMSFRWTGHEITLDSRFILDLNLARNADEFRAALSNFAVGGQNWIWADVHGDIDYFPYVLVPQRPAGTVPYLPVPGTGEAEWLTDSQGHTAWLPADQIPQAHNPAAGFLSTANNDQLGLTLDNDPLNGPLYLGSVYDIGFREQRIQEMLSNAAGLRPEGAPISMQDMSRYQYDTQVKEAERLLPFLFDAATAHPEMITTAMQEALDRLHEWEVPKPGTAPGAVAYDATSGVDPAEGRSDITPRVPAVSDEEKADAVATSIYAGWSTRLDRLTFDDDFAGTGFGAPSGDDATKALLHILEDVGRTEPGFVIHTAGADGQSTLWDDKTTTDVVETRDDILLKSLSQGLDFLNTLFGTDDQSQWLWGKIHRVEFQHFFAQGSPITSFDLGPFAAPGARFSVDPAGYSMRANSADSFIFSGGPSMRFVIDLDPAGVHAVNVLPGGNNGNPGSVNDYGTINPQIHYGDHIAQWINGETFPVYLTPEEIAGHSERRVVFQP